VLIDYGALSLSDRRALGGLHDSKQMTPAEREKLYPCVLRAATRVSVVVRCVRGIDRRGLHNTNIEALSSSLERVARGEDAICLVDGFRLHRCSVEHRPVVDGDATSAAIAAASVIAKVSRDRYMRGAHSNYPDWGFEENVGYSTPEHRDAIARNGICALHRRSFASVAYRQLALDGELPPELEGVADVIDADEVAAAIEEDANGVEADRAMSGDELAVGEPGAGEGADAPLLRGADGEDGARRAA
jgi:ribonuclease HII